MIKEKAKPKKYSLTMKFNNEVFKAETDDLAKAIVFFKPTRLKTRTLITIKKGDQVCERQVFTPVMRRIFIGKVAMRVFLNTLIFK